MHNNKKKLFIAAGTGYFGNETTSRGLVNPLFIKQTEQKLVQHYYISTIGKLG